MELGTRSGAIDRTLDSLVAAGLPEMIVIMPDGDDGWYTTWNNLGNNAECRRVEAAGSCSPRRWTRYCVPWPKYDDYIARDLVARVDSVVSHDPVPVGARHRGAEHGRLRRDLAGARVS